MFNDLPNQIYKALIANDRWMMFLEGLGMTLLIAIGAVVLGLLIGMLIAVVKVNASMKRKSRLLKFLDALCNIYLTVIRGTPMMVQDRKSVV